MWTVIVRCGRCRSELEIPGPGEFVCPACGTRNVARGPSAAADPYSVSGAVAGSGLTVPGGAPIPSAPPVPPVDVNWAACPSCGHRFAMGEIDKVRCPNCRIDLVRAEDGALKPADS